MGNIFSAPGIMEEEVARNGKVTYILHITSRLALVALCILYQDNIIPVIDAGATVGLMHMYWHS